MASLESQAGRPDNALEATIMSSWQSVSLQSIS